MKKFFASPLLLSSLLLSGCIDSLDRGFFITGNNGSDSLVMEAVEYTKKETEAPFITLMIANTYYAKDEDGAIVKAYSPSSVPSSFKSIKLAAHMDGFDLVYDVPVAEYGKMENGILAENKSKAVAEDFKLRYRFSLQEYLSNSSLDTITVESTYVYDCPNNVITGNKYTFAVERKAEKTALSFLSSSLFRSSEAD